ncbi:MAG: hypothetical protein HON90_14915, partial [Halobacteriovoraceae bacterium]|nr:hypothetical protein [Halobacteriovoraceae bacterium]
MEFFRKFSLSFQTLSSEKSEIEISQTSKLIISSKLLQSDVAYQEMINCKSWDMLIIDESHQLNFSDESSQLISCIKNINKKTYATLFLSATPEVLGVENLFNQLNFIDPYKYTSFEQFNELIQKSQELSKIIRTENLLEHKEKLKAYFSHTELESFISDEEVKQALIDRFGTGRNYYRNSRKNLENYSRLFNERVLFSYPIGLENRINDKIVFENKLTIVYEIIKKYSDRKILIICHSKNVVLKLIKELMLLENFKLASFHSDQSVMERDRQAAYFADEEGAQVLISTEVGSEGRNFEFSNHLILFDLPKLPDQLEQRIGRLDRIGQENDINIHIPYILNTFEQTLFSWYDEVLKAFTSSPKGANAFYEIHHDELTHLLNNPFDEAKNSALIKFMQDEYFNYQKIIEQGRDYIIETHSYHDSKAKQIIKDVQSYEEKTSPLAYIEAMANEVGINSEELNDYTNFYVPSDNMLIPSFPGLRQEGFSVTFSRDYALKFDNIEFMTWEHPFVKGCFETMLNSPLGNFSLIKQEGMARNIYFEFIVSLQCSDEYKHTSALYLPYTPIRTLYTIRGEEVTKKYPKKFIDELTCPLRFEEDQVLEQIPRDISKDLFDRALKLSKSKANKYIQTSIGSYQRDLSHEVARVKQLSITSEKKS